MYTVQEYTSEKPQFMMFSATIPPWVKQASKNYLSEGYKMVDLCLDLKNKTAKQVKHYIISCPYYNRNRILGDILLTYSGKHGKSIVFTQTKKDANSIVLDDTIDIDAEVLHGDIA